MPAARGDGQRLAAIVPPEFAAELEDLSPEEVLDLLADLTDDRADPPVDS